CLRIATSCACSSPRSTPSRPASCSRPSGLRASEEGGALRRRPSHSGWDPLRNLDAPRLRPRYHGPTTPRPPSVVFVPLAIALPSAAVLAARRRLDHIDVVRVHAKPTMSVIDLERRERAMAIGIPVHVALRRRIGEGRSQEQTAHEPGDRPASRLPYR